MALISQKYGVREYISSEVISFRKTKEKYGGLSNMCSGYVLNVNNFRILTSEALYQACRFPDNPDVQKMIIEQRSPMTAKMKSKPYRNHTRHDWEEVRVPIMRWCLGIKIAQNYDLFGSLLQETYPKLIVEDSRKDKFWGAVRQGDNDDLLVGVNALGRLLMELRDRYLFKDKFNLLRVLPLDIPNFKLFGEEIGIVDERSSFINNLIKNWRIDIHSVSTRKLPIIDNNKSNIIINDSDKIVNAKKEKFFASLSTSDNTKEEGVEDETVILEGQIKLILKHGNPLSSKEIKKRIQSNWDTRKLTSHLKKIDNIKIIKGSPLLFTIEGTDKSRTLFE